MQLHVIIKQLRHIADEVQFKSSRTVHNSGKRNIAPVYVSINLDLEVWLSFPKAFYFWMKWLIPHIKQNTHTEY